MLLKTLRDHMTPTDMATLKKTLGKMWGKVAGETENPSKHQNLFGRTSES